MGEAKEEEPGTLRESEQVFLEKALRSLARSLCFFWRGLLVKMTTTKESVSVRVVGDGCE